MHTNVVLMGHVCIDRNVSEHSEYTSWGSSVLYMARYLRKHIHLSPAVVTSYGPDLLPYLPIPSLTPAKPSHAKTLIYENNSQSGKRIQHCYQTLFAVPPALTDEIVEVLEQADIVVLATLLPNYTTSYVDNSLKHIASVALKVLCPQGYFRHVGEDGLVAAQVFAEATTIIPQFDLVIYSEEDTPDAFPLAREWARAYPAVNVVVTQGADGATYFEHGSETHVPTQAIPADMIMDSVGCGDVFAATVAYEYYVSNNLRESIVKAHKAARAKLLTTPLEEQRPVDPVAPVAVQP